MFRLPSPFEPSTERVVTEIIDCAVEVHRQLGPGLLEGTYGDAMSIELEYRGLRFERERQVMLRYRDRPLRTHRLDLVVEQEVVLELKAVLKLEPVHRAQVLGYLRASGLRLGLLINFNSEWLRGNIRRIIL